MINAKLKMQNMIQKTVARLHDRGNQKQKTQKGLSMQEKNWLFRTGLPLVMMKGVHSRTISLILFRSMLPYDCDS